MFCEIDVVAARDDVIRPDQHPTGAAHVVALAHVALGIGRRIEAQDAKAINREAVMVTKRTASSRRTPACTAVRRPVWGRV